MFFLQQLEQSQIHDFAPLSRLLLLDEVEALLPGRSSMTAFYQIVSMFPMLARKSGDSRGLWPT
jgi:hypothetical protein